MKTRLAALLAAAALTAAAPAQAQLGFGARIGMLGLGGEAALEVTDALVLRGGVGVMPWEPTVRMSDIEWKLDIADRWYTAGLDVYLNRVMRVGGGVLFKTIDPRLDATLGEPIVLGGRVFAPVELGSLTAIADSGDRRPYAVVGFGRHTSPGAGAFVDLGAVWMGDPTIRMESGEGTFADQIQLDARLRQAEMDLTENLGTYLKVWLILSLGLRFSVG